MGALIAHRERHPARAPPLGWAVPPQSKESALNPTLSQQVPIWAVSLMLVLVLMIAWVFGLIARWLLRGRARLGTAASIVVAILGSAVGLLIAWLIRPGVHLLHPLTIALALGVSVLAMAGYAALAAHFQQLPSTSVAQLLLEGESDRVEFKSTARVNLHTGARDDRMENVIAKTTAAFLNADGGTLLIGVDDAGTPLGLDADFATLKAPDVDRYELWLRDLLVSSLGPNAAAAVSIEFEQLPDAQDVPRDVCRVTAVAAPRPVFLKHGKNASPELWVRSGNSTRQLGIDAGSEYIMHRWPLGVGATIAAQVKAAARFSGGR